MTDQIAKQKERLDIVNGHLADLELLFSKGLIRKEEVLNQRIEKALVEAAAIDFGGPGRAPTRRSWASSTSSLVT